MKDRITIALALVLVALVAIEFFLIPHEHPYFPWHHLPGYAALIGLLGCFAIVLVSKALGEWFLQRPERDD
jgi:hypothetical protein